METFGREKGRMILIECDLTGIPGIPEVRRTWRQEQYLCYRLESITFNKATREVKVSGILSTPKPMPPKIVGGGVHLGLTCV